MSEGVSVCRNCNCEFSLEDPDIKIISEANHGRALIEDSLGRAHSLLLNRSWEDIQKKIASENSALFSPSVRYAADDAESDNELEHKEISLEKAGLENTAGTEVSL
jgi:hypothetical protein